MRSTTTATFSERSARAAVAETHGSRRGSGGFEQAALPFGMPAEPRGGQAPEALEIAGSAGAAMPAVQGSQISPHLLAARRLSRRIRRLPDRSDEQTRTGLAICQHLRLLLAEDPAEIAPPH